MKKYIILSSIICLTTGITCGQLSEKINPQLLDSRWEAQWITHPEISGKKTGVYLFRKTLMLESVSDEFIINVSADNRYKLYINGQLVGNGPSRGDLLKWRYETINIAPYLKNGENAICVKVWNFGELRPGAQFSVETGLIIQGNSERESIINTDATWKVIIDKAYSLFPINHLNTYYVTGPGEKFESINHPWQWLDSDFDDISWKLAKPYGQGTPLASVRKYGNLPSRALYPRDIPLMESKKQHFSKVRRSEGIDNVNNLLSPNAVLSIPANSSVSILLDQEELTNAYPKLHFSKGKGSQIKITYAETLFHTELNNGKENITNNKGNRGEIKNKKIKGNYDLIISDGGNNRQYEPLWWRTFRYVQLDISTKEEPLQLDEFYSLFTGYPLSKLATFDSNEPQLSDMFDVGWRTQRLCAGETFFDCPYYEQLQYSGDTRIQGLVTYYVSGDTLLWQKSITDFYDSRLPNGLTQSRYPGYDTQLIPEYSLVWVTMLWDYMMHGNDRDFIQSKLPAVLDILQWYQQRMNKNGLPGKMEGWHFIDWVDYEGWDSGTPPLDQEGNSSIIGLQYVYTIQKAVELFEQYQMTGLAKQWKAVAVTAQRAIIDQCWDEQRGLMADTPEKKNFSQHANILAVLTDAFPQEQQKEIILKIYKDETLAPTSFYFRFYLSEAIKKAGLGNLYLETLSPWSDMLEKGLTTFAEAFEPTRSDCHAWSASPLFHFYSLVCGIEPATPGFEKVKISPNFGKLEWIEGNMPHRLGEISMALKKTKKGGVSGQINLPAGLDGNFYWEGKQIILVSGANEIEL